MKFKLTQHHTQCCGDCPFQVWAFGKYRCRKAKNKNGIFRVIVHNPHLKGVFPKWCPLEDYIPEEVTDEQA